MKRHLFLSLLLIAVGITAMLLGAREWNEEARIARQAGTQLDSLRQHLKQTNNTDAEPLREKLDDLMKQGFFQKPIEANFAALAELNRQSEMEATDAKGVTTGTVTFSLQARHMVDFVTRLQTLQRRWRTSSTPSPTPLFIEQCQFVRAQGLTISCRARWQAASWPGEQMPENLSDAAHEPFVEALPVLGRLFFTPEERAELDREARAEQHAKTGWQGMVRLERTGKGIVLKDGLFVEIEHPEMDAIGGTSHDLLRGGSIHREEGKK